MQQGRTVLDKDKNVKAAYDYSPYGVLIGSAGDPTFTQPYQYSTKRTDAETGIIYFGYRFYLPNEGRWLNRDPIEEMGGLNLYQYVGGDPVNYIDPFGLYYSPKREHGISHQEALSGRPGIDVPGGVAGFLGGASDFYKNYGDMRDANTIGGDKYFHCKANCEASQRGAGGRAAASCISDTREWVDENIKGDPPSASAADQEANHFGRDQGSVNTNGSCKQMCSPYRPNGLPQRY